MSSAPKAMRCHIAFVGRRNVGKSSLINLLTGQNISLVSDIPGTTTDPVEKTIEIPPIGPVVLIDTAGIDDDGLLGKLRVERTQQIYQRTDLMVLVYEEGRWGEYEEEILGYCKKHNLPIILVKNKIDLSCQLGTQESNNISVKSICVSTLTKQGLDELRQEIIYCLPKEFLEAPALLADLVKPYDTVLLVVKIDSEAPKGRLILPQVQVLRELLDNKVLAIVVQDTELEEFWKRGKLQPSLVITDSQIFKQVATILPKDIPLTGFSLLFARVRGDLATFALGAKKGISSLQPGDKILMAESCTHHSLEDDIGRVKIPALLEKKVGGKLEFTHVQGHDFPEKLTDYKLIIHCGACMTNRREILTRLIKCQEQNVPVTNYGMLIAYVNGLLNRALQVFPAVQKIYKQE